MIYAVVALSVLLLAALLAIYHLIVQHGHLLLRVEKMERESQGQAPVHRSGFLQEGLPKGTAAADFDLPAVSGGRFNFLPGAAMKSCSSSSIRAAIIRCATSAGCVPSPTHGSMKTPSHWSSARVMRTRTGGSLTGAASHPEWRSRKASRSLLCIV